MKILITGGAGFIGSHLVDSCVARGDAVFVIDNLSSGLLDNIREHITERAISFREADIRDAAMMQEIFAEVQPDIVYHLAAQINVRESIRDPAYDVEVNILGTLNILEAMRKNGCNRIIFSSTGGAMFGGDNPPYAEDHEAHPETPYGISKRSVELLLEFYQKQHSIAPTMLRYANVYGPRQNAQGEAGVVSIFLDKIQRGEQPTIFGDGAQTRDFVHVADVVSANIHAQTNNLTGIYHVGTGKETSVNELWNVLAVTTKTHLDPLYAPALGEIQRTALDASKLEKTGWKIQYDIAQGIQSLI